MRIHLPDRVTSTLAGGRQAHVAAPSRRGPHVTPELYTWTGGALWFAAATTTVKAKVFDRDAAAAAAVRFDGRTVLFAGQVEVVDVRRPLGLITSPRRAVDLTRAVTRFAVRNAPDLVAFTGDAVTGKLGRRPSPARLLFRLDPDRAALVENDAVTGAWGAWSAPTADAPTDVPAGGQPAMLALTGPVVLPGRWFPDEHRLHVAPALLALVGLADDGGGFPVGVVVDDYRAPGPAAKQGTLLRGEGRLERETGWIAVDPGRLVTWDGIETASEAV